MFTSRLVLPSAMTWTEKSACVANLPRSHKTHTRALPAAVVMVMLLYCGWYWYCYYICLALSSLLVTCNEKAKEKNTTKRKKMKIEFFILWIQKRKCTAVLVQRRAGKRNNEKKKNVTKSKKSKNFERVPQQIIPSSAITG